MIPRKPEIDAAVAVLESEDFETPADMARAIVKAVAGELARREHYAIVPQGAGFAYGTYWTTTEAERAWKREVGASFDGPAALLRVFPWSPPEAADTTLATCVCGHQPENHVVKNQRGGKTSAPRECGVRGCGCAAYGKGAA